MERNLRVLCFKEINAITWNFRGVSKNIISVNPSVLKLSSVIPVITIDLWVAIMVLGFRTRRCIIFI